MTNRIFNKILSKDLRSDYQSITSIMENNISKIFPDSTYKKEHVEDKSESINNEAEKDEFIEANSSLVIENYKDDKNIKIISANRTEMELDSITKIIPIASGKYESISDFIDRHKRLLQLRKRNQKEVFIFNLASKRSITSSPNMMTKETLMMKSLSTTGTTVAKTAINTLSLGSFQMMSTILTSTFGSVIGVAVSLFTLFLSLKKQGGSRQFFKFTLAILISQLVVTIIAMVIAGLFFKLSTVGTTGIVCIVIFTVLNQIGKWIIQYNDAKVALAIEKMYDGYLYAKVKNKINLYD